MTKKLVILLFMLCAIFLGLGVFTYFLGVHNILPYNFQFEYGEGFSWKNSLDVSLGNPLYKDTSSELFFSTSYTPLFFLASGFLIKLFGSSLLWSRLISVSSFVVIAFMVGMIVNHLTKSKAIALISGMLVFIIPMFRFWTLVSRVDTFGLMFAIIGLYFAVKNKFLTAVPFLVLAFFTKQSLLAIPASIGLYLLISNRKVLLKFVSLYFGLVLIGLLICWKVWGQQMLIEVFIRSSSLPWSLSTGTGILANVFLSMLPLIAIALIYLMFRFKKKELNLLSIYWVVSLVMCFVASCRIGAYENSFLDFMLINCILSGLLLKEVLDFTQLKKWGISEAFPLLFPLLIVAQSLGVVTTVHNYPQGIEKIYTEVHQVIKEEGGLILSVDPTFLLTIGENPLWEPNMLTASKLYERPYPIGWSQEPFIANLKAGKYNLVILHGTIEDFYSTNESFSKIIVHTILTDEGASVIRNSFVPIYKSGPLSEIPQGVTIYKYEGSSN